MPKLLGQVVDLALPLLGLLLGGTALVVVIVLVRRWITSSDVDEVSPGGFVLGDLRQLVREGKMTAEEFEQAKAKIVEATRARLARQTGQAEPGEQPKSPMSPPTNAGGRPDDR